MDDREAQLVVSDRPRTTPARRTVREIEMRSGHRLLLSSEEGGDLVQLLSPDGDAPTLSLRLGAEGAVLELGGSLELRLAGELRVDAESVALHGRTGMELTTDGDMKVEATGDLESEARIQRMKSRLGNVEVEANDDVRIDGERVMVNC